MSTISNLSNPYYPQVPPGVFNVVTSPREFAQEIGLELCTSPKARTDLA